MRFKPIAAAADHLESSDKNKQSVGIFRVIVEALKIPTIVTTVDRFVANDLNFCLIGFVH